MATNCIICTLIYYKFIDSSPETKFALWKQLVWHYFFSSAIVQLFISFRFGVDLHFVFWCLMLPHCDVLSISWIDIWLASNKLVHVWSNIIKICVIFVSVVTVTEANHCKQHIKYQFNQQSDRSWLGHSSNCLNLMTSEAVKVITRCRPLNQREKELKCQVNTLC